MQLSFGNCELDLERRELRCDGLPVHTRAKVFDVLSYLIANRDRLVSRDELLEQVWRGVTVSDATLSSCILEVRRAIGDNVSLPAMLKTVRGQGFRFIAEVARTDAPRNNFPEGAVGRMNEPSIAILPFANLNADQGLDYLADGLAEDITAELSRYKVFAVIARNSSFQYRGAANDVRRIGEELQADYVLEGSIRRTNDVLRVTAQLIHAPTTRHIWSDRYDCEMHEVLTVQDDILRRIVASTGPEIAMEEIRRLSDQHAGDLHALEMAWRARALLDRGRAEANRELYLEGMQLAEKAVALDPLCRHAWWTVSFANYVLAFARAGQNPEAFARRAREAAEKLRAIDRNDHRAYMSLGWISFIERDLAQAQMHLEQAHELNPNCNMTLTMLGIVATALGDSEAGYNYVSRGIRLSPRDLWLGFMLAAKAFACFPLERYEEGAQLARRAIQHEPNAPANHIILAACLVQLVDLDGAAEAIGRQRTINEGMLARYLEGEQLPFRDEQVCERYSSALWRAVEAADGAGDGKPARGRTSRPTV